LPPLRTFVVRRHAAGMRRRFGLAPLARRIGRAFPAPLRALGRVLLGKIRLERDGMNVHVTIEAVESKAPPDPALEQARPMQAALANLLDSHPMSRRVLRHLGYFERALRTHGLRALKEVPVDVLSASFEQLDSLVHSESGRHLVELRSKMFVALLDRSKDDFDGPGGDRLSEFCTESRLMVDEASHSMFLEFDRQFDLAVRQDRSPPP